MRIAHMLGDDAEGAAPPPPPLPVVPPAPLGGFHPSPLVIGGVGALLLFQSKGLLRLLGAAGLGWAALHMKPHDVPALQDLVSVQLSGCRGCR